MSASTIDRRALLGAIAAVPAIGALATPPKVFPDFGRTPAKPALTPDVRIAAAIEEIKAAFWEKWPDAPLRIVDTDNIEDGLILILSHVHGDEPGQVSHRWDGLARDGVERFSAASLKAEGDNHG